MAIVGHAQEHNYWFKVNALAMVHPDSGLHTFLGMDTVDRLDELVGPVWYSQQLKLSLFCAGDSQLTMP